MNPKPHQNPHRGSDLREFLEEEGLLEVTEARAAMKQILETTRANNTEPMVPLKRDEIYDR